VRTVQGEPIADAQVCCHLVEGGPLLVGTSSGADGHYELNLDWWRARPPLDRRSYGLVVVAQAPGHNSYTHLADLPSSAAADGSLELAHDFVLHDYLTIRGRIVDRRGDPVAAAVTAFGVTPDRPLYDTTTADALGQFRLVFADDVVGAQIDARHAVAGRRRFEVELPSSGERDLGDIVLEPGLALQGRVALLDGTPVPDCEVFVRGGLQTENGLPRAGPGYWYFDARTDAEGRFAANRSTLGAWSVIARCGLGLDEQMGAGEHHLPAQTDVADVLLDGVRADLVWRDVEGRELLPQSTRVVVFAADAGDAAAAARAGDSKALRRALVDTWSRGACLVVPRGAHVWLQVHGADGCGIDELLQVPPRNGRIDVELRFRAMASTSLTVRVRFADGGVPESFSCRVYPRPGASLFGFEEQHRSAGLVRGRCAVGPIGLDVQAYPEMFDDATERRTFVAEAGRDNEIDVVLARRGRIRFVLRDVTAPQRVVDDGIDGDVTIGAVAAGRFFWQADEMEYWGNPPLGRPVESMSMVPIGRHDVRFELHGYEPLTVAFDVTEQEPEVVLIWLQPR